jgi:hypothetical protein
MLKTGTRNTRHAAAIAAALAARKQTGRGAGDAVVTGGNVCYYDNVSGFLLIVPREDAGAGGSRDRPGRGP